MSHEANEYYEAFSVELALCNCFSNVEPLQISALFNASIVKEYPFITMMCGLSAELVKDASKFDDVIEFLEKYIDSPDSIETMATDFRSIIHK